MLRSLKKVSIPDKKFKIDERVYYYSNDLFYTNYGH